MTLRAPKGTDDIMPPASRAWRRLLRVWDDITERYGYDLVMTPIFESTELFARGVGEGTEVVAKQMYTFTDKGGRSVTLRPEQTASVVRAYLQSGTQGTLKVAYAGPQFRYERPQAGRRRQFFQTGVEYLGEAAPEVDVEVVELGYRFLEEVGLTDVDVLLNSIGGPESRPRYRELLRRYLAERRADLSDESIARMDANPMGVLDSKVDGAKLADAPAPVDHLAPEDQAHFAAVRAGLERRGIPTTPAPRLVRGLDYYNRTVFEYVPRGYEAAQSSVGGGGRYDGLAELLGGPPVPGMGLAMGVDRILLALGDAEEAGALDLYVVVSDETQHREAESVVDQARTAGMRADRDLSRRSVKAQFRAAERLGAAVVAVVGDDPHGGIAMTDRRDGGRETVPVEEVTTWIRNR